MAKQISYTADDVDVLVGLEGVRQRPAMYLGNDDVNGTLQCFEEIFCNCTDELRQVDGGKIFVKIKGNQVTIADEGRGIPTEIHKKTKVSTLETVMTHLHAGGKLGNKSAYKKSTTFGTHGVGASVVNALSDSFSVWSFRVKKWWRVDFAKGKVVKKIYVSKPPFKWSKGTIVSYTLDKSILKEPLNLEHARQRCNLARYFNPVDIRYEDDKKQLDMVRKEPSSLLNSIVKKENVEKFIEPISINENNVRTVFCWTNATDVKISGYVSGAPIASGTHIQGLEQALTQAIANVASRDSKNCNNPLIGLRAIIDVSVDQPTFSGQNKTGLKNHPVKAQVVAAVEKLATAALKKQKTNVTTMLEHASRISDIDAHSKKMKEAAKVGVTKGTFSFPKGAIAALDYPPERRETYIVEGNSAEGSLKKAKMPWQEILPMRGKMANVINKKGAILKSEAVGRILSMLGYDPLGKKPLRTGKVILMADADDDGYHITVLLMTIIQRVMPKLLEEGRVYIIDPPLFEAMTSKGDMVSGNNLKEMEEKHGKLTSVNRMKGLGGCTVPLLRHVATNPDTRQLLQLKAPSVKEANGLIDLMGADPATRKKLVGKIKGNFNE